MFLLAITFGVYLKLINFNLNDKSDRQATSIFIKFSEYKHITLTLPLCFP